eukprot:8016135-Pyramimonas_sp.AAC.1
MDSPFRSPNSPFLWELWVKCLAIPLPESVRFGLTAPFPGSANPNPRCAKSPLGVRTHRSVCELTARCANSPLGTFIAGYFNPRGGKKGIFARDIKVDHKEYPPKWFEGLPKNMYIK